MAPLLTNPVDHSTTGSRKSEVTNREPGGVIPGSRFVTSLSLGEGLDHGPTPGGEPVKTPPVTPAANSRCHHVETRAE